MYEKLVQAMIDAEAAYWADGPISMADEHPPLPFHGVPGKVLIDAVFDAYHAILEDGDRGINGKTKE
jgi:hypothetical protein